MVYRVLEQVGDGVGVFYSKTYQSEDAEFRVKFLSFFNTILDDSSNRELNCSTKFGKIARKKVSKEMKVSISSSTVVDAIIFEQLIDFTVSKLFDDI